MWDKTLPEGRGKEWDSALGEGGGKQRRKVRGSSVMPEKLCVHGWRKEGDDSYTEKS